MRLSRHCYDKPRRCPGWAGGGFLYARKRRCVNGRLKIKYNRWSSFTFHRCDKCDVLALPIVVKWLDPSWWRWWVWTRAKWRIQDWRYERLDRARERH